MGTPITYISGYTNDYRFGSYNRATVALNLQSPLVNGYQWWNGVDVTSTQYLIYSDLYSQGQATIANSRPTAWTTPNLNDSSLLALINTLPDRVGLPGFTDVDLALNWMNSTNKYFLIKTSYESIVTTNLELNLDCAWFTSYSGGTTWRDISGNANNSTLINSPTFSSVGQGSILLDGSDDYVLVASNGFGKFNSQAYTIESWVNFDSVDTDRIIFSYDFTSHVNPYYAAHLRIVGTGAIFFSWNNSSTYQFIITPNNTISTNQWYHIVGIYESGRQQIFVNGQLIVAGSATDTVTFYNQPVWVGRANYGGFFDGEIGVVRYYKKALTVDEVLQNYNSQKGRYGIINFVQNGLISNFDASNSLSYPGTGTLTKDLSSWESNFTLYNGVTWNIEGSEGYFTFDGADDYMATSAGSVFYQYTTNLSVSFWLKRNGAIAGGAGGGQSTPNVDSMFDNVWLMHGSGTEMIFYVNNNGSWISVSTGFIPDNTWTHIAGTCSASATKIYVNGVLIDSTGGSSQITNNSGSYIAWGKDPRYASGRFLNGQIKNAQVYNRTLSDVEILQNYQEGVVLNGSTAALAAPSANYLWNNGITTNGLYYIQTPSGAVQIYCDFTTLDEDGSSGWMHVGTISDDGGASNNPTTMPWGAPLNPAQDTGIWQDTNTLNEGSPTFTGNYKNRVWYSLPFRQMLIKDQGATQRNLLYTNKGQITENNESLADWFGSLLWDALGSENSNSAYQNGRVTGLEITNFGVSDPIIDSGGKTILLFKFGEKDGAQDGNKDRTMIAWHRYNAADNVDAPAGIGAFTNRSGTIDYRNIVPYAQRQDYPYPTISGGPYNVTLWVK